MANPQVEDGHIDIANEIAEQLCKYRISGEEHMVLWAIIRKTYGWKKKEDRIALSQFAVMTGLKRQTVLRAINKLSSKKIIDVIKNDDSQINLYRFNKNFDQWEPLSKKITVSSKKITTVIKKDNQVSSKKVHTKDNITKDTLTKDNKSFFILPDWIPEETWKAYLALREKKKAAKTTYALNLIISELLKIKETHNHDPVEVLNKSIKSGWIDVYPLKDSNETEGSIDAWAKKKQKEGSW